MMKAIHNPQLAYRPEIDGLRAIAVLPVILFHAGFTIFSGGFVGVDVFFVISGYLITAILLREIMHRRFSVTRFYERRARRILPALFVVVLASLPLAFIWMLPEELERFGRSIVSLASFSSNYYFKDSIDYFAPSAEDQPLLHTWSLAVEEQFYLLFPLFLLAVWRWGRGRFLAPTIILAMASLALCEWSWRHDPYANFYLLPTRAWELLGGSLLAFLDLRTPRFGFAAFGPRSSDIFALLGLVLIGIAIFAFDRRTPFPSLYALLPVGGAMLVIHFGRHNGIAKSLLASRPMVGLGLISYSAYLWHQPLFAMVRAAGDAPPSPLLMAALAALSLVLAWYTWKYVETPFRKHGTPQVAPVLKAAAAGLVAVALTGWALTAGAGLRASGTHYERVAARPGAFEHNYGVVNHGCRRNADGSFNPNGCATGARPQVLLWGDSFAMHLGQLFEQAPGGIVQATVSSCFPNSRLTPWSGEKSYTLAWARECHAFARSVLDYADASPDIHVVVISSTYFWPLIYPSWDGTATASRSRSEVVAAMAEDVAELRRHGKRVVFVSPTPQSSAGDPLRCAKRALLGAPADVGIDDRRFQACEFTGILDRVGPPAAVENFLAQLSATAGVTVVDLRQFLCDGANRCSPMVDGTPVYFDWGHLSPLGTRTLQTRFDLRHRLEEAAR